MKWILRFKQISSGPKRKRMRRPGRLISAKAWLKGDGKHCKNIVRAYRRYYGVDFLCAFKELKILGVRVDPEYEKQVLRCVEKKAERRKKAREEAETSISEDSDGDFSFIAGYTSNGFPYGERW